MAARAKNSLKIAGMILLAFGFFGAMKEPCHRVTRGFSLFRITDPLEEIGPFAPPELSALEQKHLLEILSQPFYYLSCGGQSYVFVSEDQQYVVKFVKFQRLRVAPWFKSLPLPEKLSARRAVKAQKKGRVLKKAFQSYVTAYSFFKEETGILYHHLQKTHDLQKYITLFDKLGYKYHLNLDQYAFIVQKKGMTTVDVLHSLIQQGRFEEAVEKLDQLVMFTIDSFHKGIEDQDIKFKANLGFINGRVMQLDLGSLIYKDTNKRPAIYKARIHQAGEKFTAWLKIHEPSLVEPFQHALKRVDLEL